MVNINVEIMSHYTHQLTIHWSSILRSSTPPVCPFNTARTPASTPPFLPTLKSQTQIEQSLLPLTIKPGFASFTPSSSSQPTLLTSQSLSNFRQSTLPASPLNVASNFPVNSDHTLIDLSLEPVIILVESNSRQ